MPNIISIPPAVDATIYPSGGTFTFVVSSNCTVCFGTATPAGSFPGLEGNTFNWTSGSTHQYPVPSTAGANLPYNTSNPGTPCSTVGPSEAIRTIHTGSGFGSTKGKSAAKPAPKVKARPKTKAKAKAAPKTKTKAKSKSKAKLKPKAKAKPKKRAKSRR